MFINIKQVKSNLKNEFEIHIKSGDGNMMCIASTPWLEMDLPFNLENLRKLYFRDINGNIIYSSKYEYLENTLEEIIPFKYIFTGEQKFCQMSIYDTRNNECGRFYTKVNGITDSKLCILYGNEEFIGYDYAKGSTRYISFYKGDFQVAQLVKTLSVIDNLDEYYLFILDEYDYLKAILSFCTIYIDYCNYRNSGEISKGKYELKREYTYSKNNKYYNPKWISDNFGEEELLKINEKIEEQERKIKKQISKVFKIIGIIWGGIFVFGIKTWL